MVSLAFSIQVEYKHFWEFEARPFSAIAALLSGRSNSAEVHTVAEAWASSAPQLVRIEPGRLPVKCIPIPEPGIMK